MSQKKVDSYKAGKNNRSVAMVAWIGFSAYAKITAKEASVVKETVVDTSAIDNYVSGLSSDTQ